MRSRPSCQGCHFCVRSLLTTATCASTVTCFRKQFPRSGYAREAAEIMPGINTVISTLVAFGARFGTRPRLLKTSSTKGSRTRPGALRSTHGAVIPLHSKATEMACIVMLRRARKRTRPATILDLLEIRRTMRWLTRCGPHRFVALHANMLRLPKRDRRQEASPIALKSARPRGSDCRLNRLDASGPAGRRLPL